MSNTKCTFCRSRHQQLQMRHSLFVQIVHYGRSQLSTRKRRQVWILWFDCPPATHYVLSKLNAPGALVSVRHYSGSGFSPWQPFFVTRYVDSQEYAAHCYRMMKSVVTGGKSLHFQLVSSFRFLHCLAGTLQADAQCFLSLSHLQKVVWCYIWWQNGALSEAVQMWKRNVDREFEGVEECPICYSIIHTSNHTLPGLACKTCKHKFHSACLYKWFSTSHKSTCPLCQTPF